MAYWSFVTFAKEAGANIQLRKTALVDLDLIDKYFQNERSEGAGQAILPGSGAWGVKKERREFDCRQEQLRREREADRLDAWLDFDDELDM